MKTLSLLLQHLLDDHNANTKRINILSYVVDNPTFKIFVTESKYYWLLVVCRLF